MNPPKVCSLWKTLEVPLKEKKKIQKALCVGFLQVSLRGSINCERTLLGPLRNSSVSNLSERRSSNCINLRRVLYLKYRTRKNLQTVKHLRRLRSSWRAQYFYTFLGRSSLCIKTLKGLLSKNDPKKNVSVKKVFGKPSLHRRLLACLQFL